MWVCALNGAQTFVFANLLKTGRHHVQETDAVGDFDWKPFQEYLSLQIPPPVEACPASCVLCKAALQTLDLCSGMAVFSLWCGRSVAASISR